MNISISNIAWRKEETNDIMDLMKKFKINGLELAPTMVWDKPELVLDRDLLEYRKLWENKGIKIIAMQSLLFGHPELTIFESNNSQEKLIAYMQIIVHLASILGIKALVFGSPKNRLKGDLSNTRARDIALKFFRKIGDIAKNSDVHICIEANPKEYGADFLTTTKETYDFVKKVNHPYLDLHLDTGAMAINQENYQKTIVNFVPFYHFHISEPQLATVPQIVDHIAVVEALKNIHYRNWVSIEMRQNENVSNIPYIEKTLAFVTSQYR